MLRVFVCSPLRPVPPEWLLAKFPPDTWQYERWWQETYDKHVNMARGYCAQAVAAGYRPYAPHLFFPQFLNERDPAQRAAGIEMGVAELLDCDVLWFWDEPTEGMRHEIRLAIEKGIPVVYKGRQDSIDIKFSTGNLHSVVLTREVHFTMIDGIVKIVEKAVPRREQHV